MNRQARYLLSFISSSRSGNSLALQDASAQHYCYQKLIYSLLSRSIYTAEGFVYLCRQLAGIAQYSYVAKQIETMDQVSQLMLALPISRELKGVAHYYQAISVKRKGDFCGARQLLEYVIKESPLKYKARALLTIGATYFDSGEVEAALPFYLTSQRVSRECDSFTLVESQRAIAIVRSIHGDHKQALDDLERLFPLALAIGKHYPAFYYEFLNGLAVELGEVGRINEARQMCRITLDSPFASAYPAFAETRDELELKRTAATPSIVAVSKKPEHKSRRIKPALSVAIARECVFIQRSVAIVAVTVAPAETTTNLLDRVEHSIIPRGPPARF